MARTIPTDLTTTEEKLNHALGVMLNENDDLKAQLKAVRAELKEARERLAAGSLGILQRMANDEDLDASLRVKAAGLAVAYERPRLSVTGTTNVVSLAEILSDRSDRGKLIEQAPDAPGPDAA